VQPERLIALGVVARPHGVRGEVRVHRWNPTSTLLLERDALWLRQGEAIRTVRVEESRAHGDVVLLKLAGVDGREAAEGLRGAELCLPRSELPALAEGELYHADLIGSQVRTEDGEVCGEVSDVITYPTAVCILVRGPDGDREVPFVEPYIVSIEQDTVIVANLEDLELIPRKNR
jgi:16S rRNA processing protein RimM